MSIKQLKGQLDAAQARASEWEEKWNDERARREDAERAVKQLRDQLQQLTAAGGSPGVQSSSSPLLSMAVPVLMRGSSNAQLDSSVGSRRLSIGSMAAVSRLSSGSSGAGGPVNGGGSPGNGTGSSGSPTHAALPRPFLHVGGSLSPQPAPLISPSTTPSPTHSHALFAAALSTAGTSPPAVSISASAGHSVGPQPSAPLAASHPAHYHPAHSHTTHVPPAGFLSPAHSAPLTIPSPSSSMQQLVWSSPSINRSPSPASTSPRLREERTTVIGARQNIGSC